MTAMIPGTLCADIYSVPTSDFLSNPAAAFIASNMFDRPTLVVSRARVATQYDALVAGLGDAHIHYAVKANPAPEIIRLLVQKGARFDAASRGEIELCLSEGAPGADISFGNTIKKPADIAYAHAHGVTLFAADSEAEIDKLRAHAPGAQVYLRVIVENSSADWPLSRKFGCARSSLADLMDYARAHGVDVAGLSFHVGSQTRRSEFWNPVLDQIAELWTAGIAAGHDLRVLNLGGGFPATYEEDIIDAGTYAAAVMDAVTERFGDVAYIMAEPGRGLVAEAGHIVAEVLLVSRKSADDLHRWVYLDIGMFSGLAETMGEAIRYRIQTPHDGGEMGACILAGPSCDSADILYEQRPVNLPIALACGDRVVIRHCGAYTSSYSSVGFNGFPPLDVVVI
jgi:ornithine decarboxylase